MTRNEALTKAEQALGVFAPPGATSIEARKFVDMAVAIGPLKLDEDDVKSARRRAFPPWNGF